MSVARYRSGAPTASYTDASRSKGMRRERPVGHGNSYDDGNLANACQSFAISDASFRWVTRLQLCQSVVLGSGEKFGKRPDAVRPARRIGPEWGQHPGHDGVNEVEVLFWRRPPARVVAPSRHSVGFDGSSCQWPAGQTSMASATPAQASLEHASRTASRSRPMPQ